MLLKSSIVALNQISTILALLKNQPKQVSEAIFIEQRVGVHIRHVHDHFRVLFDGLITGTVDYNVRSRDSSEERNIPLCCTANEDILFTLSETALSNRKIVVGSEINCEATENLQLESNVSREFLYLINHTVHHVAIIKLIIESNGISCPDYLGLAPSTASYFRQMSATEAVCAP